MQVFSRTTYKVLLLALSYIGSAMFAASQTKAQEIPPTDSATKTESEKSFEQQLAEEWTANVQPILQKYCASCHGNETSEAEVNLEKFPGLDSIRLQPATWDQIRGVIKIGAMPPVDEPMPSDDERTRVANWIENVLHRADCSIAQPPGHVTLRRLNRAEYDNTLRDLLGIEFRPSAQVGFASDDVGNGFDNQGEVLSVPPLLLEKYLQAAEAIAKEAIVTQPESLRKQNGEGDSLFVGEECSAEFLFANGEYSMMVRMRFGDGQDNSVKATIFVDDVEIATHDIEPKSQNFDFTHTFQEGKHRVRVKFTEDPHQKEPFKPERKLHVERFKMEGPKDGMPALPMSHRSIITSEPSDQKSVAQAATESFRSFLRRAYRRPADPLEIERIVSIVEKAHSLGLNYSESMQYGLQAVLVSPQFLFRVERESGSELRTGVRRVDSWDLASRLSYFLWSSSPDDLLLNDAESQAIYEPANLANNIDRMLDDPRSQALVDGFFAQWLGIRNLSNLDVDGQKFPLWNEKLRGAMRTETDMFFKHLISREGKLADVLQADFTFVNPRLAELYGLQYDGVEPKELYQGRGGPGRRNNDRRIGDYKDENRWIRVPLPEARRGMLTQASILTLTSNPSRTSPVKRGKWILENILGEPPPAAPPNVPTLDETQKEHQNVSLRQQLEIHRSNPACASCHKVMDPIGLGLENFDAIGQWRDTDQGSKIDAAGTLADGRSFSGATELLSSLEQDKPKIAKHFARKLLTYALGRGLTTSDECAVEKIVHQAEENNFQIRTFIKGVVMSEPFQLLSTQPANDAVSMKDDNR